MNTDKKTILVFAGNYQEYKQWTTEHPGSEYVYTTRESDFLGRRNCSIVRVGTWDARPGVRATEEAAREYFQRLRMLDKA